MGVCQLLLFIPPFPVKEGGWSRRGGWMSVAITRSPYHPSPVEIGGFLPLLMRGVRRREHDRGLPGYRCRRRICCSPQGRRCMGAYHCSNVLCEGRRCGEGPPPLPLLICERSHEILTGRWCCCLPCLPSLPPPLPLPSPRSTMCRLFRVRGQIERGRGAVEMKRVR